MEWAEVCIVIVMAVLAVTIAALKIRLRFIEKPKPGRHPKEIKEYGATGRVKTSQCGSG